MIVSITFCRIMVQTKSKLSREQPPVGVRGRGRAPVMGRGQDQGRLRGVDRDGQSHRISSYASSSIPTVEAEDS